MLARINAAVAVLTGGLLFVATLAIMAQVTIRFLLTRFGMSISAPWTEELCRYCVIWSVFLGSAVLARDGRLIAVDYLLFRLPAPTARWLEAFAILVTILFFVLIGWLGLKMAHDGLIEKSPVMRIPMTAVYAAMPVGAALALINCLALMRDCIALKTRNRTISEIG